MSCNFKRRKNEFKDITDEVQGELLNMRDGTSTVVNEKLVNTGYGGTFEFYPKDFKVEILNKDLR